MISNRSEPEKYLETLHMFYKLKHGFGKPQGFYIRYSESVMWVPHPQSVHECCKKIKPASFKYPWVWYNHARSLKHLAVEAGLDYKVLRSKALRILFLMRYGEEVRDMRRFQDARKQMVSAYREKQLALDKKKSTVIAGSGS
jgi:hypothetical protein